MTDTPRIYVASLSDYNAGNLHGAWIDADQTAEEIEAEVQTMLASGAPGAEEWAIHDHEGFAGLEIGEYESFERVAEWARLLGEYGPAFAAYVDMAGADHASLEGFEDAYRGEFGSIADYAEQLFDDCYPPAPDGWPFYCIDWERAGRDLELGGDNWTAPNLTGGVFVFRSV